MFFLGQKNKAKAKARIKNPFIKFDVHVPDIPHCTFIFSFSLSLPF